jgi:glycosyltransferase involved in cell wall biosynthesis
VFEGLAQLRAEGTQAPASVLLVHHLTAWENGTPSSTESRVVQAANRVIVTSEMSARRLAHELGVQAAVCVPGADRLPLCERRADRRSSAPLELLFVGTWTERKGLLVLIQALGSLQLANYRLRIVGDQARDPAYCALVQTEINLLWPVVARVQVCGAVSDSTLAQLYASADVLVLPSFFEGYGMVLCEALRAGLALVASNVGAVPEVAHDGEDARLVPAGNVEALAAVLNELITDRAEVQRLQANAARRTLAEWSAVGQRFRNVLTTVLD